MQEYDENIAVKKINEALLAAGRHPYNEDELLNIVDMIWDYYEENGLLDLDFDDEDDDENEDIARELVDYVTRMLRKDKASAIRAEDVALIVDAELAYEDSTLDFD